jgi:UDP-N-acetylglucosamine 2-epimerase (non-hydrolysing)
MAPVIKELERYPGQISSFVCVTAQHRGLLDQVLDVFDIRPDTDLNIMKPGQTLSELTANLFVHLDQLVSRERPDWILVQGDTTSVMVASLVAYYHHIRVGHVEAGLRTADRQQPFPEEINRRITDLLADLYFAPTETNRQNLLREGVPEQAIVLTGNTIVDALQLTVQRLQEAEQPRIAASDDAQRLILVTAHRRENFGHPLAQICGAVAELARRYRSQVQIVYPVHPNPNVQGTVRRMLSGIPNVVLTEPLGYSDFVQLMNRAYLILTDSGGLQEEAPSLGIPVLVLREVTERPEGVAAGVVRLVGTNKNAIVEAAVELLEDAGAYARMAKSVNPYGDGRASQRIVKAIFDASNIGAIGLPTAKVADELVLESPASGR